MKQSSVMLLPVFIFLLLFNLHFASAPVIDADYITIYPGEQGKITLDIDNNENFDIEDVSVNINLDNLPFSSVSFEGFPSANLICISFDTFLRN